MSVIPKPQHRLFTGLWYCASLLCAGLLLRAGNAAGDASGDADVPTGALVFLGPDQTRCPTGFRLATEAAGRLVVAVANGDAVGKQIGTALESLEDRTHTHSFTTTVDLPYRSISAADGGNRQGAAAQRYIDGGISAPAASGLPFIQLMACVKQ